MNSGAVAPGKDGKMKEEEKEARELVERIKKLGLNDATIGDMVDEIERLRAKTDGGATVPCSGMLCCRVRDEGETMRSGDIVLIGDNFRPLGFHTDFYYYFAGLVVVEGMTGKIICKAS